MSPYKDKKNKLAAQRAWHARNKDKAGRKVSAYRDRIRHERVARRRNLVWRMLASNPRFFRE